MSKVKSKKVKYVFSDYSQVIHLWANQSQEWAGTNKVSSSGWHHCPSERRVSFRGVRLYSYNTQIAEVGSYRGHKVALVSSEKYSNTTTQHQSSAMSAFDSAWIVLEAPELSFTKENIEAALLKRQDYIVTDLMLPFQSRAWYLGDSIKSQLINRLARVRDFNSDAKALGFSHLVIDVPEDFQDVWIDRVIFLTERTSKKHLEKREAYEAEYRAQKLERYGEPYAEYLKLSDDKRQEYLEKEWIKTGHWPFGESLYSRVALVRIEGNTVYTSHGAEVSLSDAKLFLSALKHKKIKKGDSVGSFTFTSLKGDVLTIGCHILSLKQCIEAVNGAAQKETHSVASNVVQLFGGSR